MTSSSPRFPIIVRDMENVSTEKSGGIQKKLLERYVEAVMHAPASIGLTATHDPREFWERHVLDALKLLETLPREVQEKTIKALDVGSGNGVPGIPVAIAMPNWSMKLLDSDNKKSGFLDMFCKFNELKNVSIGVGRAETQAHEVDWRGAFDLVFARALGKLPTVIELCIPFLKLNGLLIVPHGTSHQEEINRSENALHELGAKLKFSKAYVVTDRLSFTALGIEKIQETPQRYPRKPGVPKKDPL
jgi:16S rRNA (guanine527-N7)-methyltransferase